jgi:hypothetical protein
VVEAVTPVGLCMTPVEQYKFDNSGQIVSSRDKGSIGRMQPNLSRLEYNASQRTKRSNGGREHPDGKQRWAEDEGEVSKGEGMDRSGPAKAEL